MTTKSPTYIDLLDEDKPIAQQKFVCVSFISPEAIIEDKNIYFFNEFVKSWDMYKSMQKYAQFTAFIAFKYNLSTDAVSQDLADFCKDETIAKESVFDDYKTFMDTNVDALELAYSKKNSFQTNTRGLKIRGVFPSQEEAELRAKLLREKDPTFDVFVGPVGIWMPWDPDAYKTGKIEFLEAQLNDLMSKKIENESIAKDFFNARVKESKRAAIEENVRKARETDNKLTQSINDNDDLVNARNVSDIEKTLFDTENVIMTKTD